VGAHCAARRSDCNRSMISYKRPRKLDVPPVPHIFTFEYTQPTDGQGGSHDGPATGGPHGTLTKNIRRSHSPSPLEPLSSTRTVLAAPASRSRLARMHTISRSLRRQSAHPRTQNTTPVRSDVRSRRCVTTESGQRISPRSRRQTVAAKLGLIHAVYAGT
jgi:hypothetical protein